MKKTNKIIFFVIICLVSFLMVLVFFSIPYYYNIFGGEAIINKHISEIIGNNTDHRNISLSLLNWVEENIHYPTEEEKILAIPGGAGFYLISNRTRFFFRTGYVSWIIKSKLGRCGEDASYFVEIMNRLGYKSRFVKPTGRDHIWAEYYTPEGYKIILDPSNNKIITNPSELVEGHNVIKVIAIDLDGNKEDVSGEYLK